IGRWPGIGLTTDDDVVTLGLRQVRVRTRQLSSDTPSRLLMLVDITDLQQALLESKRNAEEAATAARVKGEFLANMSHELRTPMNAVVGLTGLLLDTKLDTAQKDYVETIRASSELLLTIIEDILDFSKIESGSFVLQYE